MASSTPITAIAMIAFHILAVAALFFIDCGAIAVMLVLWWVAGSLGIGMGYHRLLTHRGYKTPKWVEYFLTLCGTLALEGGPIFWVATHRIHHQHSDHDGDPHTPREGTYWAHMGWIMTGKAMHHDTSILARYTPDLSKDRFHVWLTTWHWIPQVVVGLVLLAFGGIPYVLWGTFFRTTYRPARDLAGELGDAPLGLAPLRDQRRLAQQLVGGDADLRRRLAQQPPRAPGVGAPRPGLVRDRHQLDRHQHAQDARPGVGRQGRQGPSARWKRKRPPSGHVARDFSPALL